MKAIMVDRTLLSIQRLGDSHCWHNRCQEAIKEDPLRVRWSKLRRTWAHDDLACYAELLLLLFLLALIIIVPTNVNKSDV